MSSLVHTYERHVITTTFLKYVPDFSSLLNIEEKRWPSFVEANRTFAAEISAMEGLSKNSAYLNFVSALLMDPETYSIARQFWEISLYVRQKDPQAIEKLFDLKVSLLDLPTIIPLIPTALLNVLRAVQRPTKRSNWGLLFLTKHHSIPCALCSSHIQKHFVRLRCHCNPFGRLVHPACHREKRCSVCCTKYMITRVEQKCK